MQKLNFPQHNWKAVATGPAESETLREKKKKKSEILVLILQTCLCDFNITQKSENKGIVHKKCLKHASRGILKSSNSLLQYVLKHQSHATCLGSSVFLRITLQ